MKRHFKEKDDKKSIMKKEIKEKKSRRQGSELECTAFIFNNAKSLHRGAAVLSYVLGKQNLPHVYSLTAREYNMTSICPIIN